ncbi:hypothetical protein [Spartinivicinus poritis]|uniref:Uncharacterized protein n=1 Tax=Spartinivicinus poritis TaxID=2994640 RepID=A0ABT5UG07_9GAMM|nr:hypothetical protein [Spartinivicinus sp. A2-2]MDE1465325.1 hypothetical protein [Spartinivicinus sp. A2-2]
MDLLKKLNDAHRIKVKAEEVYRERCKEFVKNYPQKPENVSSVEYFIHKRNAKFTRKTPKPWTISHVVFDDCEQIRKPFFSQSGQYVAVKPCDDNKTYLGVLIGELCQPVVKYDEVSQALTVTFGMGNPAIWVPDLNRVVMGYESWWSKIKRPDDLKQITDADIINTWYVQVLKQLSEQEKTFNHNGAESSN